MIFNINDKATVRLTDHGKRMLREHHDGLSLPKDVYDHFRPQWETDQPVEFSLWEIMNLFGSALYMGSTTMPFVNNAIEIEQRM